MDLIEKLVICIMVYKKMNLFKGAMTTARDKLKTLLLFNNENGDKDSGTE